MAKLVETFQRLQKIETACMPKDDPAPVYLLDEILELARSSPEQAQAVADAIERKLANRSPVIKFKALRVIKHLCTKGCATFQRCMQRHSSAVRELVHYRGEPDPFKGDVPNARVREFAKEVLEVLFNADAGTAASSGPAAGSLAAKGRIQGFGSDGPGPDTRANSSGFSGGGYGGHSGGASGGMAALSSAAASLSEGPIAAGVATVATAINEFLGNPSARTGLAGSRYGNTSPSRNGGGYSSFEPGADYRAASSAGARASPAQMLGSEEGLVDDITAPAGLRPTPDASDLRRFVDAAGSMDGLRLAELLRAKMEAQPAGPNGWQVALRALCALEAVLQRGSSQACGEVAVMFQSEPSVIRTLAGSQQALVRDAAARCLRQLLGEEAAPAGGAAAAGGSGRKGAKAAPPPAADLLSLDDELPAAAAASAVAAGPATAAIDLLGDLAGPPAPSAAPAAAPSATSSSLFSGLDVGSGAAGGGAPAAAAVPAVDDLFGGLSLAAPTPAAPAVGPAMPAPVARPAAAPLDDLFGLSSGGPAAAAPALVPQQHPQQHLQQPFVQMQQQQQQQHMASGAGPSPMLAPVRMGAPPGGLGMAMGGAPLGGAGVGAAQHGGMGPAMGRVMQASGGGGTASPSAAAAAAMQQLWSGGLAKDLNAFDFVQDELKR